MEEEGNEVDRKRVNHWTWENDIRYYVTNIKEYASAVPNKCNT
jgi:hypothetical protein